jgi:hypothetical protein
MEDSERGERRLSNVYKLDYENLDVAEVMEQVRQRAAKRAASAGDETSGPDEAAEPEGPAPQAGPPAGLRKRIKSKVQRFLTPFFPLQRLLAFPVHEDLMQAVAELHKTNVRLDRLQAKVFERDLSREYVKLLHVLVHNLVAELTKLRVEHEALKMKSRVLEKDFEHLGRRERALEKRLTA